MTKLVALLSKNNRGFALVIVMVIGVAALTIALAMMTSSGKLAEAETHSVGAEQASALAQSGLKRGVDWASAIAGTDIDFDLALDPDVALGGGKSASCDFSVGPPTPGTTTGVPPWSDGTRFSDPAFMNGQNFIKVAYGEGAYLVHTEDNDDDNNTFAFFDPSSSNHPGTSGGGTFCVEGDDAGGANNPYRDRDRAIWITAVGIWPGTDPVHATHRALIRKLVINPKATGGVAFVVEGDIQTAGIFGNNDFGSVEVTGKINAGAKFCGTVTSQGSPNASVVDPLCALANPYSNTVGGTVSNPVVPLPTDGQFYDWTTACNFYREETGDVGFFYWDPTAVRGAGAGVSCGTNAGNVPVPNSDVTSGFGACWTPIMLKSDGLGDGDGLVGQVVYAYQPFESGPTTATTRDETARGAGTPGAVWNPLGAAAFVYADPGTGYTPANHTLTGANGAGVPEQVFASYFTGAPAADPKLNVTVPDWRTCNGGVKWNPQTTGAVIGGCGLFCDGTRGTILFNPGLGAGRSFQMLDPSTTPSGNVRAYVTGTYYLDNDYDVVESMGAPPLLPVPSSVWPMITVAVAHDFKNTGGGTSDVYIGVGQANGSYPSLIVGHDLDDTATGGTAIGIAGYVYVGHDTKVKKNLNLFGPVMMGHHLNVSGGGNLAWTYIVDMLGTGASAPAIPPIVEYPSNF